MYTQHAYLVPEGVRRCWSPRNYIYGALEAAMRILGVELRSSERTRDTFNHVAISPVYILILKRIFILKEERWFGG